MKIYNHVNLHGASSFFFFFFLMNLGYGKSWFEAFGI